MAAQDTPDRGPAVTDVRAHLPRHLWFPSPEEQAFIAPWNGPGAQHALAYRHEHGDDVPQDIAEAYRLSADQGHVRGLLNLAHAYHHGEGVQKDHGAAEQAYRRAAEQGNPIARRFLNHRYPPRAE